MALPKFRTGEHVSVGRAKPPLIWGERYEVLQVLRGEHGPVRYRVKAAQEKFERILDESRLVAAL